MRERERERKWLRRKLAAAGSLIAPARPCFVCWVLVDRMFRQLRCFHWAFSSGGAVARARCPATLYARDYVFRRRPSRPTAAKGGKKEKEKEMTNKKGN